MRHNYPLRVGVIGAHPERSWAKDSHIPAIQQVPGLELTAVATRDASSARAAAKTFGAHHWFDDTAALCRSDHIDVVAVCVKVPEHAGVIELALNAGKHVYCEWPLGRSLEEAEALARHAATAGTHCVVGLQGSAAPAVRKAVEFIDEGRLGRLLSARILSTTVGYASRLPSAYAYLNDPINGANLTTILGGHTLDLAETLLGRATEVDAIASTRHPTIELTDTGGTIHRTTPDQLAITARFESGCVATVEVAGDRPATTPFSFELTGDRGTLRLHGGHPHGFQAGLLALEVDGEIIAIEEPQAAGGLQGAAANVGEVYAALARDVRDGTRHAPDFDHAVRLTRLVSAVTEAATSGNRQWLA